MRQETKLHFVWSMCSDISSSTQPGRTLGPPRAVPFQMCPLTSLHLPVWTRLRCLSLTCFHGKETRVNGLRGRQQRHPPADASVQVTGATPSWEGCLKPRDSPSAEVPLYWSLWVFPRLCCEDSSHVKKHVKTWYLSLKSSGPDSHLSGFSSTELWEVIMWWECSKLEIKLSYIEYS